MWIRPLFTIIPLNSLLIPQIGKFGIIFDAIPREIDDLAVSSRHSSSSINGSDETFGCESLTSVRLDVNQRLSHICSIEDGLLKFCHVVREEESSRYHVRPIENQCLRCQHASIKIDRSYLMFSRYNSSDQRLRLKHFKMNHRPIKIRHVPPHLSEDRRSRLNM